ncbi:MAG: Muramoyl-pentapeptide carboxypeptidase [Parcubacteria group bacterium GW2011_GWB1_57_6]|nr:MAG: Muramoyl-pentapeptide carboxypeptidase [Parcubacteria group bacterium GW2011_GWA1_56_13]KKW45822.1 MAG: Muramoyl-pentapeptide carboxypeptidase [Parcubacteria group bacterium GW2011_GWB1_57_6]
MYWFVGAVFALLFAVGLVSMALPRAQAATLMPITRQLDFGSTGTDVSTLQTLLASSPALYPAALVTGYYGPLTRMAVIQFQLQNNLPPVGRVGPLTRAKLNAIINSGAVTIDVDSPMMSNVAVATNPTTATISWTTNEPAIGKVHWSTGALVMSEATAPKTEPTTSGFVLAESSPGLNHSLVVSGLGSRQTYYYNLTSLDTSQNVSVTMPATFTTP